MTICPRCAKNRASIHTCTPTEYAWGLESELARLRLIEAGARDSEELVKVLTAENATIKRERDALQLLSTDSIKDADCYRSQLTASRAEAAQAIGALKRLRMYILDNEKALDPRDHACVRCRPESEILVQGFLCDFHFAESCCDFGTAQSDFIPRSEVEAMQREAVENALVAAIEKVMDAECVRDLEGFQQMEIQTAIFTALPPPTSI